MKTNTKDLFQLNRDASVKASERLVHLSENRIPEQMTRCLEGNPELDYLIALCTDYVLEAQNEMNVNFQKVEAALQLIQQSYRLEAHMYAREQGQLDFPLGADSQPIDVYTRPRRSHKVWEMGYYFGLICRSQVLTSDFRMLPYTRQFLQNNIFDEFRVIYYHFLRQMETPQMGVFLKRSSEVLTKIPIDYAANYHSYFPLWRPVMEKNEAELNLILKEVIAFRKDCGNHGSIETLIPMVAILSYAYDMGMRFDMHDLPQDLITGHFTVGIDEKLEVIFEAKKSLEKV